MEKQKNQYANGRKVRKLKDFSDGPASARHIKHILSLVCGVLIWWLLSLMPGVGVILAGPQDIIRKALPELLNDGSSGEFERFLLVKHIRWSFQRVLLGWAIAFAAAIPTAFLMGWYRTFRDIVDPWIQFLRTIPPIALIPMVILLMGTGEKAKITVIFITAFLVMTVTIYQGNQMKKFTAILLALVLVLGLAACSSNKPQNPQPTPQETTQEPQTQATEDPGPAPATINVIYHPTIGGSTAIATAISQGYFEEENLTVNLQMYTSGPPEIAAMVAKQADVGFIGSGAAWLAFSGQVNIIALDNIALTEEIITRADNGINSIADLKGKTVAVQEGAAGYTLLVVALQEAGISVSDVKILNISNDNLASTFSDASIDAWAGWKPATTSLKEALGGEGAFTLLANNASYPEYAFPSTWVANKEFVAENPDVVQRFVNALTKAQIYRSENGSQACAYASTYAQQATNELTVQLADVIFPSAEQFKEYYNTDSFYNMLVNLRSTQAEKVTGEIPMEEVYIDTFAKAAIAELG